MIDLILTPVGAGLFRATWLGRTIVRSSGSPFVTAAKKLRDEGFAPGTEIVARHGACGPVALRSTIGVAADEAWRPKDPERAARARKQNTTEDDDE